MKLNNIDLNKLKCFQAVALSGSLQDGASELNLTTSAVYQSIKKLEDDLNVHLFYRTGKKYIVTDDGRELLNHVQSFNQTLEHFINNHNIASSKLSGEIKLGLPLNFSKQIFIPIMKKFSEKYPDVQFFLTIAETNKLLNAVANFELNFAITDDFSNSEHDSKIIKTSIFKEELVMISSNEFFKKNQDSLSQIKHLKNLTHLGYSKSLPLIQRWYHLVYKKQVKIGHFHVIDNVETMIEAIKYGLGIGIVPKDLIENQKLLRDFHVIDFKNQKLYNELFLVQESNYIPNLLSKKFLEFFVEEIK